MNSGAVAPQEDGKMCDFMDCEKWKELDCSQFRADIFLRPTCYRPLIGKTDDGTTVPCSGVLSDAEIILLKKMIEEKEKHARHAKKVFNGKFSRFQEAYALDCKKLLERIIEGSR